MLNFLISFRRILERLCNFLCRQLCHFANKHSFVFSFQSVWLFFLPYCTEMTSIMTVNRNGKSRYRCLITNVKGKVLILSLLNILLAVGFLMIIWSFFFSQSVRQITLIDKFCICRINPNQSWCIIFFITCSIRCVTICNK